MKEEKTKIKCPYRMELGKTYHFVYGIGHGLKLVTKLIKEEWKTECYICGRVVENATTERVLCPRCIEGGITNE